MKKNTQNKFNIKEAEVLEELFMDQLIFKFEAIANLYTFEKKSKKEILSFVDQLKKISKENIKIIRSYDN